MDDSEKLYKHTILLMNFVYKSQDCRKIPLEGFLNKTNIFTVRLSREGHLNSKEKTVNC